jgi:transposase-like protein
MSRVNNRYSSEFKIKVIEDMRSNNLSYSETARKYDLWNNVKGYTYPAKDRVMDWEKIYLEYGVNGFSIERRGRGSVGTRKPIISKESDSNLIEENQRLRMELDYLKKLQALVLKRKQVVKKKQK